MYQPKSRTKFKIAEGRQASVSVTGKGPAIVFLHGFPDTFLSFSELADRFSQLGYKVYSPLLPGYEPDSFRPGKDYFPTNVAADIAAIMEDAGESRFHLVGHDWGALVAAALSCLYPDRLHSLTLLSVPSAPAYLKTLARKPAQLGLSWYILLFQIPGLANAVVSWNNGEFIGKLWTDWSPGFDGGVMLAEAKELLLQTEILDHALSYYRCLFRMGDENWYKNASEISPHYKNPLLMACGRQDGCIDADFFSQAAAKIFSDRLEKSRESVTRQGKDRLEILENCGHFLHLERPDAVFELLREWISSHQSEI